MFYGRNWFRTEATIINGPNSAGLLSSFDQIFRRRRHRQGCGVSPRRIAPLRVAIGRFFGTCGRAAAT
jgi:hypothetical protein